MRIKNIDGSRLYDYMMDFIKIGWRRAGTKEAHETCTYILKKFDEFGLQDTKIEPFEMLGYTPMQWKLRIKSDLLFNSECEINCFPAWHSKSSDIEGTEAELVFVGLGTAKDYKKNDVREKIVLVDSKNMMSFYPTMDYYRAYEKARLNGAVGLISIHDTPPNTIFAEYVTRHQTFKDTNLESGSIPALRISHESGEYLKKILQLDESTKANLLLKTKIEPTMTDNLIGMLPGKNTDDIILIGTHVDSWFDGAIDNAGANAGFLELANYFSQVPFEQRKKTMIFSGFAGHEVGSIGVIEFARKHGHWFDKISTYCMIDGFGSKGFILENPSRGVVETRLDEAKGLFTTDNQVLFDILVKAAFKENLAKYGPLMHVSAVMGPFSDLGPLVQAKVPSIMVIGKGIFYHTIEDTADKVLPEQLERTTRAHVQIFKELHRTPSEKIKKADRKGLTIPKNIRQGKKNDVRFNFNIVPNPVTKNFPTLIYLTSYTCTDRIIVDLKWNVEKLELHAPICPYKFRHIGEYEVKLTLLDNFGNEYVQRKIAYVLRKQE
ncbi:MAG: M28 family peptidase [Candidatus Helarchaeota archaeon]